MEIPTLDHPNGGFPWSRARSITPSRYSHSESMWFRANAYPQCAFVRLVQGTLGGATGRSAGDSYHAARGEQGGGAAEAEEVSAGRGG